MGAEVGPEDVPALSQLMPPPPVNGVTFSGRQHSVPSTVYHSPSSMPPTPSMLAAAPGTPLAHFTPTVDDQEVERRAKALAEKMMEDSKQKEKDRKDNEKTIKQEKAKAAKEAYEATDKGKTDGWLQKTRAVLKS